MEKSLYCPLSIKLYLFKYTDTRDSDEIYITNETMNEAVARAKRENEDKSYKSSFFLHFSYFSKIIQLLLSRDHFAAFLVEKT